MPSRKLEAIPGPAVLQPYPATDGSQSRRIHMEAVQVLALNAETYPSSSAAHSVLAEAYSQVGRREEALDSCRRALELNPTNAQAAELLTQISAAASLAEGPADDG